MRNTANKRTTQTGNIQYVEEVVYIKTMTEIYIVNKKNNSLDFIRKNRLTFQY